MSDHDLELVHPFYGSKDGHTVFCTCGWASVEYATPGAATIAGWQHIHTVTSCTPICDRNTEKERA